VGLRGPEPPFLGAVYRRVRGIRWEVVDHYDGLFAEVEQDWQLRAMTGAPRHIWRSAAELRDRKKWKFFGVTTRAV
jgi:hypothetical protein